MPHFRVSSTLLYGLAESLVGPNCLTLGSRQPYFRVSSALQQCLVSLTLGSRRRSRLAQRRLSNCHDVDVKTRSAYLPPLRFDEILQTHSTRARRVLGPRRQSRALVARDRRRSRHTIAVRTSMRIMNCANEPLRITYLYGYLEVRLGLLRVFRVFRV